MSLEKIKISSELWILLKQNDLAGFKECLYEASKKGFCPESTFKEPESGISINIMITLLGQILTEQYFKFVFDPLPFLDAALSYCKDLDAPANCGLNNKNMLGYIVSAENADPHIKSECIKLLAKHGADVNYPTGRKDAIAPLFLAYEAEVAQTLLDLGADIHATFKGIQIVSFFLMKSAINPMSEEYKNAPKEIFQKRLKCLKVLLKHTDKDGLQYAAAHLSNMKKIAYDNYCRKADTSLQGTKVLLDQYLNLVDDYCLEALDMLLNAGAELEVRDWDGDNAITMCGSHALFKKLLELGCNVNSHNHNGETLLSIVASDESSFSPKERLSIAKEYLDNGGYIDPQEKGSTQTPLFNAAKNCDLDMIRLLASHGADLNYKEAYSGYTPVMWGFELGPVEISLGRYKFTNRLNMLRLFEELGADLTVIDNDGETMLHKWARLIGDPFSVLFSDKERLKHNFDDYIEALEILIRHTDINAKDQFGRTAASIMIDCTKYTSQIIPYLGKMIEFGADFEIKDNGGHNTLDRIKSKKSKQMIEKMLEMRKNTREMVDEGLKEFIR